MDAVTRVPTPVNEPVLMYAPGSAERTRIESTLKNLQSERRDLPMVIGGKQQRGGGDAVDVVQPHQRHHVLGTFNKATAADAAAAVTAAKHAAPAWRDMSFDDRAAILLKAADLLAGPWRETINGATMLGQSKSVYQAEIDAACELIDFWRFNVSFARRILEEQPQSSAGLWNRLDHRPLEGFVYAVTPFNFTAIAGNLPTAPALMGNVVVWKPAHTQQFAASLLMYLLQEAGLPPGVINMVTGDGKVVSDVVLADPDLAGIHFTGSTAVFQMFWSRVGANITSYRSYPRIVGETGGKDFVVAHPSADVDVLRTALTRGAFEYQGQKCSAASRAYVPRSLWGKLKDDLVSDVEGITMGDVNDLSNFMGAVIDDASFAKLSGVLAMAKADPSIEVIAGGTADDSSGWFVRPTLLLGSDPSHEIFTQEYFGPVLSVHVYADDEYDLMLDQMERVSPYALTGSIIAQDRAAIAAAQHRLRFAAGNFYVNDKPTGAVVGQQPFGGGRASGTNDKAGSPLNLTRWVSPRSIKETFVPPKNYRYPHLGETASDR
ncbi:MAG TPA: L-glutamate gamma-semialdehyde dehydrogenase [Actinomycetes bacterium]|nr:L-glutamate gamma-semialdehyde dehydrogenase [Actinomycetes bacterium]